MKVIVICLVIGSLLALLTGCGLICGFCLHPVEAEIYAAQVSGFNICTPDSKYCDATKAEGPPDETSPWSGHFVSLGKKGGYIIATMERAFTNGPGPDLRIYEVGSLQGGVNGFFDVHISRDSTIWIQVADDIENDPDKPYASVDIAPNAGEYLYIKVIDESTRTSGQTPGSDIDALEALWTLSPCW